MSLDPEVSRWWSSDRAKLRRWLQSPDSVVFVIEDIGEPGGTKGILQASSIREDPDYEYAAMDIALLEGSRGRGLGPDALRTVAAWLFGPCAFHRITIDPAAENVAAIRAYEKAGFRRIGLARMYERGDDGKWHDNVLLDLLPEDLATLC
jgi:aminoglycoside 6'-N-acetyltransferase